MLRHLAGGGSAHSPDGGIVGRDCEVYCFARDAGRRHARWRRLSNHSLFISPTLETCALC